jgi:hypothetical protein
MDMNEFYITDRQVADDPRLGELLRMFPEFFVRDDALHIYKFYDPKMATKIEELDKGRPVPPHASGGGEIRTQRQAPFELDQKKPRFGDEVAGTYELDPRHPGNKS